MNGGFARHSRGFTIVEVMIVLAVSMSLFIGAVALINGKQDVAAFNQSVGAVKTELQQYINQVGSGYYPNDGTVKCKASGSGGVPSLTTVPASDNQGASEDCLFLGKVIQFGVPGSAGSTSEYYNVYTLVGLRSNTSLSNARIIAQASNESSVPNGPFEAKMLQYGLSVSRQYYSTHPGSVASIGFITNLSSLGAGDGSQRTDVIAIPGTTLGNDEPNGAKDINDNLGGATVNPAVGVGICFNSGGTQQSALITLGGTGRQGSIDTKIFSGPNCT